jgi:hypothetical protein
MNNLSWSGESSKKKSDTKEYSKIKKVDYKKELSDLEKIHSKIQEKYNIKSTNPISSALVNIRAAIDGLKREIEDSNFINAQEGNNKK